jgi:flagellar protein FliS
MWNDAYLESRVLSADPLELIHILYEHTLRMVQDARWHLAEGNIPARGKAISRAIAALSELDICLDRKAGGSISKNLGELYQYMRGRLLTANIKQQDEPLAEVESLVRTLGEAWSAILPGAQAPPAVKPPVEKAYGGRFAPEPQPEYAEQGWSA